MASDIRNIFVSFSRHNVLIRQQCKGEGVVGEVQGGVVGKHVALHARYNFRFRCPLLRLPLTPWAAVSCDPLLHTFRTLNAVSAGLLPLFTPLSLCPSTSASLFLSLSLSEPDKL